MGKTIFITEKPSVAQEYKKVLQVKSEGKKDGYIEGFSPVLNKDIQITWAVGHLISLGNVTEQELGRSLKKGEKEKRWSYDNLPILPDDWYYKVNYQTQSQFRVIQKLYTAKDIDCIYYAGDSGREGIYIQALIRNQIFNKDPKFDEKVVWIDSYTKESILNGIKNAKPYSAYQNMIDSGYMRAKFDWLIGMNFTESLTLKTGSLIAVGRVMTPTLAMIVNRDKEIKDFKPTDYFGINAMDMNATWKANKDNNYDLYKDNGFSKKEDAESLIAKLKGDMNLTVEDVKVTEKKEFAPLLFNLADLQAHCSKNFHISPAQTLSIVQSLYEKKLTTYPRTDARVLSSAVAKEMEQKFNLKVPAKYVNDEKITDHYAIIPTFAKGESEEVSSLSKAEQAVYAAIYKRTMAIFKPAYIYDSINIVYKHSSGERFYKTGKKTKQLGWKELYKNEPSEEAEMTDLPVKGAVLPVRAFELNAMQTKPPAAYTTGSLIRAMEKSGKLITDEELREQIKTCGIGTSATRAGIIEKLKDKEYITIDKSQKVSPTEKGKALIPIVEQFDKTLVSPEKTAEMEQLLSDVAGGTLNVNKCMDEVKGYIESSVSNIKDTKIDASLIKSDKKGDRSCKSTESHNCPCCGEILKYGRFGYYCGCGFSFGEVIAGHNMKEQDLVDLIEKGKTKTYSFKSKTGKSFKAHLIIDTETNKTKFEFDN